MRRGLKAFTLIELLIVVAIIAILAAIAVPNFLEAQTRAKVSRCLSDMRSMRTGIEAYYVDNNRYFETDEGVSALAIGRRSIFRLTTPISYLTAIPASPFKEKYGTASLANPKISSLIPSYLYVRRQNSTNLQDDPNYYADRRAYLGMSPILPPAVSNEIQRGGFWLMKSVGPDNADDRDAPPVGFGTQAQLYDPTNGTVSRGDIVIFSDKAGTGKAN